MLADILGLPAVLAVIGQHLQDLQRHGSGLPGEVLQDILGILNHRDHDRHPGFLRDLEGPVAEGQQRRRGLVAHPLGINAHRDYVFIQQLHRLVDGLDRRAVVLPIQRQAEAHMHDLIDDGDLEVFLFGNKGQREFRKAGHGQDRVEDGTVVAHQQKARIPRDQLPAGDLHPHAHQEHAHLDDVGHQPVVKAGAAVGGTVDADKDRQQRHQQ